mmetsp:Transcript_3902/g.11754  ORF Transcript_3902/g.11754 Transcript_3902/m.11754 type:complete len:313 (-) Transcript_3902:4234-5172(-)
MQLPARRDGAAVRGHERDARGRRLRAGGRPRQPGAAAAAGVRGERGPRGGVRAELGRRRSAGGGCLLAGGVLRHGKDRGPARGVAARHGFVHLFGQAIDLRGHRPHAVRRPFQKAVGLRVERTFRRRPQRHVPLLRLPAVVGERLPPLLRLDAQLRREDEHEAGPPVHGGEVARAFPRQPRAFRVKGDPGALPDGVPPGAAVGAHGPRPEDGPGHRAGGAQEGFPDRGEVAAFLAELAALGVPRRCRARRHPRGHSGRTRKVPRLFRGLPHVVVGAQARPLEALPRAQDDHAGDPFVHDHHGVGDRSQGRCH